MTRGRFDTEEKIQYALVFLGMVMLFSLLTRVIACGDKFETRRLLEAETKSNE